MDIHVVPDGDGWAIEREGESGVISTHRTQQEAIDRARDIARGDEVELVIHGADGQIRAKDSEGNDPRNIPG